MNKESYAYSICETLHHHGYLAYYAGGYVRDRLLGIPSDDIDIATDAPPDKIQALFKKTLPLGIAFGIVLVIFENQSFEVATFRKDLQYKDGRRPEEVAFSSPEEDALRRDFTINGMFYDPLKETLLDFVGGREDLKDRIIRAIGDPFIRFEEDKLRMVRACRFAARFDAEIDPHTKQAILSQKGSLFPSVSIERITQELKKMAAYNFKKSLVYLFEFGLLQIIFPILNKMDQTVFDLYLHAFDAMPKEAPMVLFLLELFPKLEPEAIIEILEYLKLSNEEIKLATFCMKSRELIEKESSLQEWVHFYAHDHSKLILHVLAARFSSKKRILFLEENQLRIEKLKAHIERKKTNKPLVPSSYLMKYGIEPGKKLGDLLNIAEEITIEHNFANPDETLKILRQTSIWNR